MSHLRDLLSHKATRVRRVLVIDHQLLLGAGVQGLLSDEAGLDVIGVSPADPLELAQDVRRYQPDVVVLDENSRLGSPAGLLASLEDYPELHMVVVSADDNRVCIYGKQEVLMTQAADLLGIIRGDAGLKSPLHKLRRR
jgi:DNA-binding NarL/FixJ family response regulator